MILSYNISIHYRYGKRLIGYPMPLYYMIGHIVGLHSKSATSNTDDFVKGGSIDGDDIEYTNICAAGTPLV